MNKIFILSIFLKPILSISQMKIERFVTLASGVFLKTFYYNTTDESYVVISTQLDNLEYPSSETELKKYYKTLSKTYIETFQKKGLALKVSSFININK